MYQSMRGWIGHFPIIIDESGARKRATFPASYIFRFLDHTRTQQNDAMEQTVHMKNNAGTYETDKTGRNVDN